jgi:hypothetical protein
MASPTEFHLRLRLIFAVIGILVGVSIFIVFGAEYRNWNVALWGLMSGMVLPYSVCREDHYLYSTSYVVSWSCEHACACIDGQGEITVFVLVTC